MGFGIDPASGPEPYPLRTDEVKGMFPSAWIQCQILPGHVMYFWVLDGLLFCSYAFRPHGLYGEGDTLEESEAYYDQEDGWCDGYTGNPIRKEEE